MSKIKEIQSHMAILRKGNKRLYFLSLVVGVFTGTIVSIYRYALNIADHLRVKFIGRDVNILTLFLVWGLFILIGIFVDFLSRKFPTTGGSGIPQVKALLLRKLDYNNWFVQLAIKFWGGLLGIGAGLSLGREGPSVQMGSYIGYGTAKIFKKDYVDEKYLVTAGSSAGLSGAFAAPLSGVIFSMEELHRFFSSKLIICTFLASIGSNFVARRIFGIETSFNLIVKYPTAINPYLQFLFFVIFGIIVAFLGKLFTVSLVKMQSIFKNSKLPRFFKVASVMTLSFIICFVFPDLASGGHHLAENLPHMNQTVLFLVILFFAKLFFTVISYSTGFPGGIFLPMLVLGGIIGKIYGLLLISNFNFSPDFIVHYMILGMAAFFVAVVRAPITGIVLILEMTGNFDHLLAIATVSIVSFYVTDLLKLEPIYEILYEKMAKKTYEGDPENEKHEHSEKTLICIPVAAESQLDGKLIKNVLWPKNTLIVAIRRGETEYIPNKNSEILAGDTLVLLLPESQANRFNETLFQMGTTH